LVFALNHSACADHAADRDADHADHAADRDADHADHADADHAADSAADRADAAADSAADHAADADRAAAAAADSASDSAADSAADRAADAAAASSSSVANPSSHLRRVSIAILGRWSSGANLYQFGRACSAQWHANSHNSRSDKTPSRVATQISHSGFAVFHTSSKVLHVEIAHLNPGVQALFFLSHSFKVIVTSFL
jgi:uncharacterized protein involved in copper resistance